MASRQHDSTSSVRKFKGTTVFDWDNEPADERPSEFTAPSSFLSPVSHVALPLEVRRARPARKRAGLSTLWCSLLVLCSVSGATLIALDHWLPR